MPDVPWRPLAALFSILLTIAVTVVVTTGTDENGKPRRTVTIRVDGRDRDRQADDKLTVPVAAVRAASDAADHGGQRDETPAGAPAAELDAAQAQQERLAQTDQLPIVQPDAAPSQRGCLSRFVQNYSSRRGVRPRVFVLHYTVSPNRPGRSDVDGITALFNQPAFAASSHYVIDADGNCNYIVRESDKSWTEAAGNPVSVSVEIINTGREGRLLAPAGYAKLGRVIADFSKRWDVPIQAGKVSGCRVIRPGIVTHQDFGLCGGGHVDISPYRADDVIAAAKAAGPRALTATDRRTCARLNRFRRDRDHGVKVSPRRVRINVARRKALERRRVPCR